MLNPDCAVGDVARVEKHKRNAKLEQFWPGGIFTNLLRIKIVKQALQQGFSGRSRWLLHNLGLILEVFDYDTIGFHACLKENMDVSK